MTNPRTCFSPLSSLAYQAFVSSLDCKFCDCRPGSVPHSGSSTQHSSMRRKDTFPSPHCWSNPDSTQGRALTPPPSGFSTPSPFYTHASLFPSPLGGTPEHPLEGRSPRKQHPSSTHGRLGEPGVWGGGGRSRLSRERNSLQPISSVSAFPSPRPGPQLGAKLMGPYESCSRRNG